MKKPTLEEVKEYFKDAKTVECLFTGEKCDITKNIVEDIYLGGSGSYWIVISTHNGGGVELWIAEKSYAKIITKKEPTYQITKETILKYNMKDEFPDFFEVYPKKGEFWFDIHRQLIFIEEVTVLKSVRCKYICSNKCFLFCGFDHLDRKATHQEVETALKNEAVKRYKVGDYLVRAFDKSLGDVIINKETYVNDSEYYYNVQEDYLEFHGFVVYSKGQWASVLEIKTIKEAEKLLNCKIV